MGDRRRHRFYELLKQIAPSVTLRAISCKLHQSGRGSNVSGVIMGVSSVDQTFQLFSECWLFRNLERREKEALFARVKIREFGAGVPAPMSFSTRLTVNAILFLSF
jgi:hypothetical protein